MTFWGIELNESRCTVTHKFIRGKGRLRVTQACFGRSPYSSKARLLVECSVRGQKTPTVLCILERPGKREICSLDIEFGEDDVEVCFSVYGFRCHDENVHLSGYFIEK